MNTGTVLKNDSIKNNFAFQLIYQVLVLAIPLVLSPYLTRTLGGEALGVYTYTNSIAYYFLMVANLGILKYGQRVISESVSDLTKLRKAFWSLYSVHALFSLLSLTIYIPFVFLFCKANQVIFLIHIAYVLSAMFDITWLFYGLEKFKVVVLINASIKVIECFLIFWFVKSASNLWLYTVIVVFGILISQVLLLPFASTFLKPIRFSKNDFTAHIKPLFIFSISVVAVSLYTVFDKTLLGLLSSVDNVAYYEYANKIVALPRTFITIIGTVLYPRACKLSSAGKSNEQKNLMIVSFYVVFLIGFASLFGFASISKQFAALYFGEEFMVSGEVMIAMCALPTIIGLGDVIRMQYLIPNHFDKEYIICIVLNAIVNIVLSLILIPVIGVYGAVVGTTAAELFGLVFQMIICRKFISPVVILKSSFPFALIGFLMFGFLRIVSESLGEGLVSLIITIFVGAFIYLFASAIYTFFFQRDIWRLIVITLLKGKKKV